MAEKFECEIRPLKERDVDAAMRLKELANWNQTQNDWRRLLRLEPQGCFAAIVEGEVVGTITTTIYSQRLAWIGMVLVDPDYRRRGIASKLMTTAHHYLLRAGIRTIKLDATPDGRKVYEALGYKSERLIERWLGIPQAKFAKELVVARGSLEDLLALDFKAFGVDRARLLKLLCREAASGPVVVKNAAGTVEGYSLTRPGTTASYLGPLVAVSSSIAQSLLDSVCQKLISQKVYVDLHTDFPGGRKLLSARGFVKQRDLYRMFRGEPDTAGTSDLVMAIGGPEVG